MVWARLDDNFHDHPKVVDRSLDAVGLWTLCLTWAHHNTRKATEPGHVPTGVVTRFAGSRAKRVAAELVDANLWETAEGGWVIHDFTLYGPPARERTSPGTPPDLSAKRRAAGSKGGKAAQQKRSKEKQVAGEQTEQVLVTPVVASNEATPLPVQSSTVGDVAPTLTQRSKSIVDAYTAAEPMSNWPAVNAVVLKALKSERFTDVEVRAAMLRLASEGRSVTVDTLRYELDGMPAARRPQSANVTNLSNAKARAEAAMAQQQQRAAGELT